MELFDLELKIMMSLTMNLYEIMNLHLLLK